MKNVKLGLTLLGFVLLSTLNPKISLGQTQTPVLESINLPFNIDGYVERVGSSYGDWTQGSQTNGTYNGSVIEDNGTARDLPYTYHIVDLYNASGDDKFGGGDKSNDDPSTWSWTSGQVLNKNDINNVNLHFSRDTSSGDLWAVMAADRMSTNGTSYLDFEFLQNTLTVDSNGSFTTEGIDGGRTLGDLLVTVEYSNGGAVDSIYFYRWDTISGGGYDWNSFVLSNSSDAFGFSNSAGVNVPYGAYGDTAYVTKQFVEVAINITAVIDESITTNICTGLYFKSVLIKGKSSTALAATLTELIAPIQLNLNIGKAEIVYSTPVCAGGGVYPATNNGPASTNGGTFSIDPNANGIAINASTGAITVSSSAVGAYKVYYSYSSVGGCSQLDSFEFVINHHISGNVYNDANGSVDNTVNGTGFNTADGNQLYAVLVNNSDEVVESVAVANDGTYEFGCGPNGTYSVLIKTTSPTVGSTGNSSDLPTNWVFTSEKLGTGTGSDGSADGELTGITVNSADVANANFGINKRPEAVSSQHTITPKPTVGQVITIGSDTSANVLSSEDLSADDNEDGTNFTLTTVEITALPANDSNEVWYNGTQITVGDDGVNPPSASNPFTINSFDNTLLNFVIYCCEEAKIEYSVIDAAGLRDLTPAFYVYQWTGAVPVQFTSVKASVIDVKNVKVEWTTATEINNELFEVERMLQGEQEFTKIGEVFGAGTSTSSIDYEFIDRNLSSSTNALYRIKQIDYDGQFDYSDVVRVELERELDVNVYPNPAKGYFVVQAGDLHEELSVELMDLSGSVIESWNGVNKCKASTEGLKPGIYSLRIIGTHSVKTMLLQVD